MKGNTKFLTLMVALAAGVASAAAPVANPNGYTTSGTAITNQATSSFTDPSDPTKTINGASNIVTTTVLPLPSFDIMYDDSKSDGGGTASNPANGINITTPEYRTGQKPGDVVSTTYYIVNTGNTPLDVKVSANTTGNAAVPVSDGTTKGSLDPATVTYTYANGATAVTPNGDGTVTLPANGVITLVQSFKIPANATPGTGTPGTLYGASPVGIVVGTGTTTNGVATGLTLNEGQTVTGGTLSPAPAATTDMQFTVADVYNPKITNIPTSPGSTTVTPPGAGTATSGYTASTPPTTGAGTPPASGTAPGTTLVTVAGDQQIAYLPADANATPDVVRFNNTLTNGGALSDVLTLTPVNGTGPNRLDSFVKTSVGTYTGKDAQSRDVVVQFLNGSNTPIDTVTVAAGGSANYVTQVTYPDSNSLTNQYLLNLVVRATSANNPNISDDTTDTIQPTQAQFGDTSSLTSGPLAVNPATAQSQTGAPKADVSYAMSVANTGTYTDSYTLTGYVNIVLKDGTTRTVGVAYSGTNVTKTGTTTVPITIGTVTTNVTIDTYKVSNVAANTSAPLTATVTIPADAAATGTSTATGTLPLPAPTLQQTASSVYSSSPNPNQGSLVLTDLNNPLVIRVAGDIVTGKFTNTGGTTPAMNTQKVANDPTKASATPPVFVGIASAGTPTATDVGNPAGYDALNTQSYLPQVNYNYRIIAKNNYNITVSNFVLRDDLSVNLQFVSATCTVYTGTTASSTPAVTAPAAGSAGTVSCAATPLLPDQTEVLDITVKTK